MALLVSGTLPAVMAENSRAGDWSGRLSVVPDRGTIASIEAIGPGAPFLSLSWEAETGMVVIQPGAAADFEAFAALGAVPELVFSLQATMRNGRVDTNSPTFRIQLLDLDDTAPTGLRFKSGGSVVAGAIGPVIGRLAVTDPDTPSDQPFRFSFPDHEDWRFEVVNGTTLKLRDGISLGLDDMPLRPLMIEVSDGRQSAGFVLDLVVLDPGAPPPPSLALAVGEVRGALALPAAERALVLRESAALADLGTPVAGERPIDLAGQREAALPEAVRRIDFLDGRVELDGAGPAARAAALHRVLGADAADPLALGRSVAALEAGTPLVLRGESFLQAQGMAFADDAAFVTALFEDGAARAPDAAELALHLGRLGSGVARAQVAVDVALLLPQAPPEPVWFAWAHGRDAPGLAAAAPPIVPALAPQAAAPGFDAALLFG